MIVKEMREADCLQVVTTQNVAHLASCIRDRPYVVPVQYVYSNGLIYSFSMPGRKVDNMRENPNVCLQIEEFRDGRHWKSVVVEGRFRELPSTSERQDAWEILQHGNNAWWEPGALKPNPSEASVGTSPHLFYTVSIDQMSGRRTADD